MPVGQVVENGAHDLHVPPEIISNTLNVIIEYKQLCCRGIRMGLLPTILYAYDSLYFFIFVEIFLVVFFHYLSHIKFIRVSQYESLA